FVRQWRGKFGARALCADRSRARGADGNGGRREIRPVRPLQEPGRSLLVRGAAGAPDTMAGNKFRLTARQKQSCRRAKCRAPQLRSKARDCPKHSACSLILATFYFTSFELMSG